MFYSRIGFVFHRHPYISLEVGWQFPAKNYSAEDGIDKTIGLFRRNCDCSAEQKTLGTLFQTVPQSRKMLGILYHGTKIEGNSRNHRAEVKTTQNSVPWNKN
jgi:hypothetical protein